MAGIRYKGQIFSGAAAFGTADHVAYDNTESGLTATDVQGAVDEVSNAVNVSYNNTESGISATDVQGALDELCLTPTYIFKEYKGPAAILSAGTIGTNVDGDNINVSITGYKAIGAMIGFHSHPAAYTPGVMVTNNRLYRFYTRKQSTQTSIAAEDWSAIVLYKKI